MRDTLHKLLSEAAPTSKDWVLYCPVCTFVGETNAAYGPSFMRNHNPPCIEPLRLWRGGSD